MGMNRRKRNCFEGMEYGRVNLREGGCAVFTSEPAVKKVFWFLCLSFVLLMGIAPTVAADGNKRLPIGEMVSKGEVRFEARENTWRDVEPFHFPVFKGVKIRTDRGVSVIALANQGQVELSQNSMVSFIQDDQLSLMQGGLDFRIPSSAQMSFKVGSLLITGSRTLHAAQNSRAISAKDEETIGSLTVHSNGSLTVKSTQGELSILDQDRILLASLPAGETLVLPPAIVSGKQRVMIGQAGDPEEEGRKALGEEQTTGNPYSGAIGAGILLGGTALGALAGSASDGSDSSPICK